MASYSIADMRAIGPFYRTRLKAAKIRSTSKLLERAASLKDRKQLSEQTGIPAPELLTFVNMADLMRVRGVAADYAELLSAVGVDTVCDLARRNPANLVARMAEKNERKPLVELLPSEKRVAGWIETAKRLHPKITY
jgi:hypothetical protein